MDLDTTIKGFTLTHESIHEIFGEICAVEIVDDVQFELVDISDIREDDDYPGIRVALKANYRPISIPLTVDVTTGDVITPGEIEYTFSLLFDDRTISILAYNLGTVLAEKIETVLSRSIANTRPRDFYDIHILYALRGAECNAKTLLQVLERTADKRGSRRVLEIYSDIIAEIRASEQLRGFWKKYQHDFDYAKDIFFDSILLAALSGLLCHTLWTIPPRLFNTALNEVVIRPSGLTIWKLLRKILQVAKRFVHAVLFFLFYWHFCRLLSRG